MEYTELPHRHGNDRDLSRLEHCMQEAESFQAVAGLFNPATAAQTVSDSTSIVGIAVMSKDYFQAGLVEALEFMALLSVSLGIMNLLPIPGLDGARFLFLLVEAIRRKPLP